MATVRAHWVCLGEGDVESGVEAGEARGPCRGVRRESASEAELCCRARDVMCVDSRLQRKHVSRDGRALKDPALCSLARPVRCATLDWTVWGACTPTVCSRGRLARLQPGSGWQPPRPGPQPPQPPPPTWAPPHPRSTTTTTAAAAAKPTATLRIPRALAPHRLAPHRLAPTTHRIAIVHSRPPEPIALPKSADRCVSSFQSTRTLTVHAPAMIQPGLERIARLLHNVQFPWKAVHVAGTNGKGSICAYTSNLLTRRLIKNGRFTSPHVVDRYAAAAPAALLRLPLTVP